MKFSKQNHEEGLYNKKCMGVIQVNQVNQPKMLLRKEKFLCLFLKVAFSRIRNRFGLNHLNRLNRCLLICVITFFAIRITQNHLNRFCITRSVS